MIAAGGSLHVCGIAQATGLPACWGQQGQANALVLTPPAIPMKNISSGQDFSCGLRMDNGHATCWGVDVFDSLAAPQGVAYVDPDSVETIRAPFETTVKGRLTVGGSTSMAFSMCPMANIGKCLLVTEQPVRLRPTVHSYVGAADRQTRPINSDRPSPRRVFTRRYRWVATTPAQCAKAMVR